MPTLKQINVSVELGPSNTPLKEYGTRYSDGHVETFIAVPDTDVPFSIHLKTEGYVAPGIAFFVYMDGEYQCNRNRICLRLPGEGVLPSEYEAEFRLRQKEEKTVQGTFVVREWTFAKLNRVAADKAPSLNPQFINNIGTIEIVALRCKPATEGLPARLTLPQSKQEKPSSNNPADRAPSVKSVKQPESDSGGMLGGMMGIFDGADDDEHQRANDQGEWPQSPDKIYYAHTDTPLTPRFFPGRAFDEIDSPRGRGWDSMMGEWRSEFPHPAHTARPDSRSDVINQARVVEGEVDEDWVITHGNPRHAISQWSGRGRDDMEGDKYLGMTGDMKSSYRQLLREKGHAVSDSSAAPQPTNGHNHSSHGNSTHIEAPQLTPLQDNQVGADTGYEQRLKALLQDDVRYERGAAGKQRFLRDVELHEKRLQDAGPQRREYPFGPLGSREGLNVIKKKWDTMQIIDEAFLKTIRSLDLQEHSTSSQAQVQSLRSSARLPKPKKFYREEEALPLIDIPDSDMVLEGRDSSLPRLTENLIDIEVQRLAVHQLWLLMPYDDLSWLLMYLGKEQRSMVQNPRLRQPIPSTVAELEEYITDIKARESVIHRFFGWLKQVKNEFASEHIEERLEEIEAYQLAMKRRLTKLSSQEKVEEEKQAEAEAIKAMLAEDAKREEFAHDHEALYCGDAPANSRHDGLQHVSPGWAHGWEEVGTGTVNAGQQYSRQTEGTRYFDRNLEDCTDQLPPKMKAKHHPDYIKLPHQKQCKAVAQLEANQRAGEEMRHLLATGYHHDQNGIMRPLQGLPHVGTTPGTGGVPSNDRVHNPLFWQRHKEQEQMAAEFEAQRKQHADAGRLEQIRHEFNGSGSKYHHASMQNKHTSDRSITPPGMVRVTSADGLHNPLLHQRQREKEEEAQKRAQANMLLNQQNIDPLHQGYRHRPNYEWMQNFQSNPWTQRQQIQNNPWTQPQPQQVQHSGGNRLQDAHQANGLGQQQNAPNNGWDQQQNNQNNDKKSGGWGEPQNSSKQNDNWGAQDDGGQQHNQWDQQSNESQRSNQWDRQSNGSKQSDGWGNNNNATGSVKSERSWHAKDQNNSGGGDGWGDKSERSWGAKDQNSNKGDNAWGDKGSQSSGSHRSHTGSSHRRSPARHIQEADMKSFIKPYWKDWNKPPQGSEATGSAVKKHEEPRNAYTYPASPLPAVPSSKAKDASHGIQTGRGADYSHKCRQPVYIDTMEKPYAVFSYKYRSKDVLEKVLKRKIDGIDVKKVEEQAQKDKYTNMPKHKLIAELMQKRGVRSKNESPASDSGSKKAASGWGEPDRKSGHGNRNGGWDSNSNRSASVKGGWSTHGSGSAKGGWDGNDNNNNGGGSGWGGSNRGGNNWGGDGDKGSESVDAGGDIRFKNDVGQNVNNSGGAAHKYPGYNSIPATTHAVEVGPNNAATSPVAHGPPPAWGVGYTKYVNLPPADNGQYNYTAPRMSAYYSPKPDNEYNGHTASPAPTHHRPLWAFGGEQTIPNMPTNTPKKTKTVAFDSAANVEIPGRELTPEHFSGERLYDASDYLKQRVPGSPPAGPQRSPSMPDNTGPHRTVFMPSSGYNAGPALTKVAPVGFNNGPLNAGPAYGGAATTTTAEDQKSENSDSIWF